MNTGVDSSVVELHSLWRRMITNKDLLVKPEGDAGSNPVQSI